ncbi:nitrogenase iron-molybdenum cofactor biosynthesis protein NifN [Acetobacter sp.]|uniref:nitrogenase iron-molybdenum cofactor biosynthesis protein NifN n=1 Tax=Acetobacter sp. TaxID=440 RepID=UPI0039EC98DB
MATIIQRRKAASLNPLKSSAPLGAALAYLGIEKGIPLFHGAQGCTSFALVLSVRHFKEAIPLQTTAMDEVATVLGGASNLEEALLTLVRRMKPGFIGVATTALVETRGEDSEGDLRLIMERNPELAETKVVLASTPDYAGALEEGWASATTAIINSLVEPWSPSIRAFQQINVLPGVHQTPADIEALLEIIESFGFYPVILPDISYSLDGHIAESWVPTSLGGTSLSEIANMARAVHTIAIGEHMRAPADTLTAVTGVPATVFPTLTGLEPSDRLVSLLARLSLRPVPGRLRRQRAQLVDAMLDGHFHFGGKRVAIAADPDLLFSLAQFFSGMGASIVTAIASTGGNRSLQHIPVETVVVGDLVDLEDGAAQAGADLLVTHSHGRQAAARLGVPLMRVGFPIFDRLGVSHEETVGYRGTRSLIFRVANQFLDESHACGPEDFESAIPAPVIITEEGRHASGTFATH